MFVVAACAGKARVRSGVWPWAGGVMKVLVKGAGFKGADLSWKQAVGAACCSGEWNGTEKSGEQCALPLPEIDPSLYTYPARATHNSAPPLALPPLRAPTSLPYQTLTLTRRGGRCLNRAAGRRRAAVAAVAAALGRAGWRGQHCQQARAAGGPRRRAAARRRGEDLAELLLRRRCWSRASAPAAPAAPRATAARAPRVPRRAAAAAGSSPPPAARLLHALLTAQHGIEQREQLVHAAAARAAAAGSGRRARLLHEMVAQREAAPRHLLE
eukprot:scaffold16112_cov63-Phaeocystis_antarctica.AAC.4